MITGTAGEPGFLQRESTVGELLGFEEGDHIGAAWITDPSQLGHHLQSEQHVVELDGVVDPIGAATPISA